MTSSEPIRILHLISGDLWAGAESQSCALLLELAKNPALELQVIVLNDGELFSRLKNSAVKTTLIEERGQSFFSLATKIKQHLTDNPCELIHTHRYKENILAAYLKNSCSISALVQTVHGTTERYAGAAAFKMKLYRLMNSLATACRFDQVIAVSDDIAKNFRDSKVTTIRNAVSFEQLAPIHSRDEVRRELGAKDETVIVGTAGRLVPIKRYDLFLNVASLALVQNPNMHFVIAGEGPERFLLQRLAKELGIAECVSFLGERSDMPDLMQAFDLFAITSDHEGIPMVLLEAMYAGTPVVSTQVGGIPEVIEDAISGVLVPAGDETTFALALLELEKDPAKKDSIRAAAKTRVESEFSIQKQAAEVSKLYQVFTKGL